MVCQQGEQDVRRPGGRELRAAWLGVTRAVPGGRLRWGGLGMGVAGGQGSAWNQAEVGESGVRVAGSEVVGVGDSLQLPGVSQVLAVTTMVLNPLQSCCI